MKKLLIVLTIILSLVFISGCDSFDEYLNNIDLDNNTNDIKISANEANSNPEYSVSSSQILKEYDENGVKAATLYKNKVVEITGSIDNIDIDIYGDAYISLTDGSDFSLNNVKCSITDNEQIDKLNELIKGQEVTVVGTVKDYYIDLDVDNCSIK